MLRWQWSIHTEFVDVPGTAKVRRVFLSLMLLALGWLTVLEICPARADDGGTFSPGDPFLLSAGSPGKDEDASAIRAQDGSLYVAWFSDRGGNADIYLTRTINGTDWKPPIRVTTSPAGDFYPTLFQDDKGIFHLVWFRWNALFTGHIWYNTSPDGLNWNQSTEVQITHGTDVDDWAPTLTQAPNGALLVYYVSAKRNAANPTADLYVAARRPGKVQWEPAVPVAGINSNTEHDHLPFVARTGNKLTLVWVRYDTSQPIPWLNPKSDVFYSTSSDGLRWASPSKITNDPANVVNLFPALYRDFDETWLLVWLSTRLGSPGVFELPLADADRYPQGVSQDTSLPAGYSHRIVATSSPGVYFGVWVQGPDGAQDIYAQFFKKSD